MENCFLSCLGHSLFMPGNPWPSGLGWVSVLLPGVHTCFLLLSRTEPSAGFPLTELSQIAVGHSVGLGSFHRSQA